MLNLRTSCELTFLVLDLVGFVDYDVVPFNIFKVIQTDPNSLETCDQDIEFWVTTLLARIYVRYYLVAMSLTTLHSGNHFSN